MIKTATLLATLCFVVSGTALADGYKLDAKGKCHDEHGKFAKQDFCAQHAYKLDSKGKCHDEHGKFAEGKYCHA